MHKLLVIAVSMALIATATISSARAEDGFSAYQTSSILGDQDTYVCKTGVKIVDRRNGNVILAAAPAWKVFAFNTKNKRICSFNSSKSYPGLGKRITTITGGTSLAGLPLSQTAKTILKGTPALELQTPKSFVSKQMKDKEHESTDPRFVQSAQMLVAEKLTIPAEAAAIICKFYGLPAQKSMPLQFKYINSHGDLNTILLTSEIKPAKLSMSDFVVPVGFQTITDLNKLEDQPLFKGPPLRKIIETVKKIR